MAAEAQDLLDTVERRCLVHSDLNPKNLLLDPESLEVTGVLDWEFAHAGHPATDLGNLLRFDRSPAYVEGVLGAYVDRLGGDPERLLRAGTGRRPLGPGGPGRSPGAEPGGDPGRRPAARHRPQRRRRLDSAERSGVKSLVAPAVCLGSIRSGPSLAICSPPVRGGAVLTTGSENLASGVPVRLLPTKE